MSFLDSDFELLVYPKPVNMHRSFNGLASLAYSELGIDTLEQAHVLFVNRKRNQFKILLLNYGHVLVHHMRTLGTIQQDFSGISKIHSKTLVNLLRTVKSRRPRFSYLLEA